MSGKIAKNLDNLVVARAKLAELENQAQAFIPQELNQQIVDAKKTVSDLENACKVQASFIPENARHTLVGKTLQMVFSVRKTLDAMKTSATILRLGGNTDDVESCYNKTQVWSIRERGKDKK